ncbi:mycofactocin-coupled SDR family oxidoreductase [Mycobacterium branderi]|uniref:3-ketoacyl-ACP reductase n=1 Tax=Mycobacterium branderi TaxID=43348 RepID=A0A7I7WCN9_9MYCO|nr:mycofactocin-coupled SDR family oxidoreductase [Mycobacterium branderi]MCV7236349.1 mycofactocin-coupled SDR family oxidoreductase [Mycobacterium branderi]ORA35512.1 3-ketoacyl-ACP reductase [Mycobacterium branderi]BBZ15234.1 oxidoreductase [Mycobacterium branderi]
MGRVERKVAFVTGAARGQGRSHALRLAQEGADIIAVDIDEQVETAITPTATADDLAHTVKLVEETGRRIVARTADVRDLTALQDVVAEGVAELGRLDIVVANAGIASSDLLHTMDERVWQEMIDINLTGVWKTTRAAVPLMIEKGEGGSVILISSIGGLVGFSHLGHYTAAKHGVTGLMRALAVELAPHRIRCNSVHPGTVDSPMLSNPIGYEFWTGVPGATREDAAKLLVAMNALKVPWVDEIDISNVVLFLASDDARYITGSTQVVDAGATAPFKIPHA